MAAKPSEKRLKHFREMVAYDQAHLGFGTSLAGMDEVCRGRGFLMRGGELDYDRCCAVVLDEFREGKVGKLTLEEAPRPAAQEEKANGETI